MPRPRNTSNCSITDCHRPTIARGWCAMHYYRWKKTGTTDPRKERDTAQVFWKRVDKDGPVHSTLKTKCWLWTGGKFRRGYGAFWFSSKLGKAHRYSYILKYGPIDSKILVLHKCDNPSCVRPSHLFLGTNKDNMVDMVRKDRQAKGTKQHLSKFTDDDIRTIRKRYVKDSSTDGSTAIGRDYKVPPITILRIVKRYSWKHVT